jgi:hypothetical protein
VLQGADRFSTPAQAVDLEVGEAVDARLDLTWSGPLDAGPTVQLREPRPYRRRRWGWVAWVLQHFTRRGNTLG